MVSWVNTAHFIYHLHFTEFFYMRTRFENCPMYIYTLVDDQSPPTDSFNSRQTNSAIAVRISGYLRL